SAPAASSATAPSWAWRTTNRSTPMASRVLTVSRALSPFLVDEVARSKFSTSAPRRVAARLKLARVRVEVSKNRVQTVRPAWRWRRPVPPWACGSRASARSSRSSITAAGRPSRVSRWRRRPSASSWRSGVIAGVIGHGVSGIGLAQPALENDHGGQGIEIGGVAAAAGTGGAAGGETLGGLHRAAPLVHLLHRQAIAAGQLAGEAAGALASRLVAAIEGDRIADHQGIGAPLAHPAVQARPVGAGGVHVQHAQFAGAAGDGVADGHADAAGADVEAEDGDRFAHAWPA